MTPEEIKRHEEAKRQAAARCDEWFISNPAHFYNKAKLIAERCEAWEKEYAKLNPESYRKEKGVIIREYPRDALRPSFVHPINACLGESNAKYFGDPKGKMMIQGFASEADALFAYYTAIITLHDAAGIGKNIGKDIWPELLWLTAKNAFEPSYGDKSAFIEAAIRHVEADLASTKQTEANQIGAKEIKLNTVSRAYVDPNRINEIKSISNKKYDLSKLVRLCEELNICFAGECYLSMVMLTRAILDHLPPVFNCSKFSEVANNYSGAKSFKQAMQHLENSSRKISDYYLHSQIRNSESLPNVTQIDFSNDLDFLLAEVVRVLSE